MQTLKNDPVREYLKKTLRVYNKITPVILSDKITCNFLSFLFLRAFRYLDVALKEKLNKKVTACCFHAHSPRTRSKSCAWDLHFRFL